MKGCSRPLQLLHQTHERLSRPLVNSSLHVHNAFIMSCQGDHSVWQLLFIKRDLKKTHCVCLCVRETHLPVLCSSGPAWCWSSLKDSLWAEPLGNEGIFLLSCVERKAPHRPGYCTALNILTISTVHTPCPQRFSYNITHQHVSHVQ